MNLVNPIALAAALTGRRDVLTSTLELADATRTALAEQGYVIVNAEMLAAALAAWWANDDAGMPGSGSWEAAGGWAHEAAAIIAAVKQP